MEHVGGRFKQFQTQGTCEKCKGRYVKVMKVQSVVFESKDVGEQLAMEGL